MRKVSVAAAAAVGFAGAAVAGPTLMTDQQMEETVAGRYMTIYINYDDYTWVLKPNSGQGSTGWTDGYEGNGNWSYYGTCETQGGGCAAYEGYVP